MSVWYAWHGLQKEQAEAMMPEAFQLLKNAGYTGVVPRVREDGNGTWAVEFPGIER